MMRRLALAALLLVAACGPKGAPDANAPYKSPFTGATVDRGAFRAIATMPFEPMLAAVRAQGIEVHLFRATGPGGEDPWRALWQRAGHPPGLYVPTGDPDALSLPRAKRPHILLSPGSHHRRVLAHEFAHHLLLSARFPKPVVRDGTRIFAGRTLRWQELQLARKVREIGGLPEPTADPETRATYARLFFERLSLQVEIERSALLAEAEAFGLQLDEADGILNGCDQVELQKALAYVVQQFRRKVGLSVSISARRVAPCASAAHPAMRMLLNGLPPAAYKEDAARLDLECRQAKTDLAQVESYLAAQESPVCEIARRAPGSKFDGS